MSELNEFVIEDAPLAWLETLDYAVLHGPDYCGWQARRGAQRLELPRRGAERATSPDILPPGSHLPHAALEDAYRKLNRRDVPSLVGCNRAVHRMLVDSVEAESWRATVPAPRLKGMRHDGPVESALRCAAATGEP